MGKHAKFSKKIHKNYIKQELYASKYSIHHDIKILKKSYKKCKSVPREMTPEHCQHREDICCQLTDNLRTIYLSELSCVMKSGYITKTMTYQNYDIPKQQFDSSQPVNVKQNWFNSTSLVEFLTSQALASLYVIRQYIASSIGK